MIKSIHVFCSIAVKANRKSSLPSIPAVDAVLFKKLALMVEPFLTFKTFMRNPKFCRAPATAADRLPFHNPMKPSALVRTGCCGKHSTINYAVLLHELAQTYTNTGGTTSGHMPNAAAPRHDTCNMLWHRIMTHADRQWCEHIL